MIHRFVDLPSVIVRLPDIPILALDQSPTFTRTLWQIGNGATPYRMIQPIVSSVAANNPHLGDPEREPTTGDYIVYCRFNLTGTINRSVRLVDWDDTTDIELYADATGGTTLSLTPTWKPDGSKILFRAKGAGTALNLIKDMDPDGSNVTTLHTGTGNIVGLQYSFDGSKIAWLDSNVIKTADADGTNVVSVVTGGASDNIGAPAWARGSLVLAFVHAGVAFTSDQVWKVVNADGTGLTTWLTISRASGYGPGDANPGTIMWSWLLDDSGIATTHRQLADPDPDSRLTIVDSGGTNLISPARYGASNAGSPDTRPVVLSGHLEGVERIYWLDDPSSPVASILPDGSDYRVDFDGTGVSGGSVFHGFRGDTVNV